MLSGHTDVVPVEGQAWTADPFTLRVADGRAHGRGAVDMKGFGAIALARRCRTSWPPDLKRPIHILLSYDEETTCLGVIDAIARFGRRPAAAGGGDRRRADRPRGRRRAQERRDLPHHVHGHEAHSAKPLLGANAVMAAGDLVAELNRHRRRDDRAGRSLRPVRPARHHRPCRHDPRRHRPQHPAEECTINWEFRGLPGLDPAEIPRPFLAKADAVTRERLNRYGPFGRIETVEEIADPGPPAGSGLRGRAAGAADGRRNARSRCPTRTEAGRFQAAGIPTVVCGPGTIDHAHQPDEFITLAALAAGEAFLRRLIEACTA